MARTTKTKTSVRPQPRRLDPVVAEIVRNGVIAVTEEMKTNLMRTAYNMIIYEALDFTVGLFTAGGRDGVDRHRAADVHPRHGGDDEGQDRAFRPRRHASRATSYVTNDAYITGSHLNHVTLTLPIFHDGELVGFSCCMAHWIDIGGTLGGMTTDIYSEGPANPDREAITTAASSIRIWSTSSA